MQALNILQSVHPMSWQQSVRSLGLGSFLHHQLYSQQTPLSSSLASAILVNQRRGFASASTPPSGDAIHIKGARFYGYHGVLPEVRTCVERSTGATWPGCLVIAANLPSLKRSRLGFKPKAASQLDAARTIHVNSEVLHRVGTMFYHLSARAWPFARNGRSSSWNLNVVYRFITWNHEHGGRCVPLQDKIS